MSGAEVARDGGARRREALPLVTVSGYCSGVGKTTLVEQLIRRCMPIAALKVTVVDSGVHGCPIDRACGVCSALSVPYRVLHERTPSATRNGRGARPRKDTGRYAWAGAHPVIWVQTRGQDLEEALAAGLAAATADPSRIGGPAAVVLEGNTPVARLAPDVALMVDHPARRETKPSARALFGKAHWVVLNRPHDADPGSVRAARRRIAEEMPGIAVVEIDLAQPGPEGERLFRRIAERCGLECRCLE